MHNLGNWFFFSSLFSLFSPPKHRQGARSGELQISLIWNDIADLDLHVHAPGACICSLYMGKRVALMYFPPLQTMSLKQDAWNTDKAALFAKAWPDAPWVFLTREPLAVLVSQMRERAFFMVQGALGHNFGGVNPAEMHAMSAEQYCAQMLGSIYAAMAQQFDPTRALLLDYAQLPDAIETQVLPHMRWQVSHADRERMRERATRHGRPP